VGNIASETGNFLMMFVAAFGVFSIVKWKTGAKYSELNEEIIEAWIWVFIAVALNRGYFAMARHLSPEESINGLHPILWEWRGLAIIATSLAFSWGMMKFISLIEGYSILRKSLYFAGFFGFAFMLGLY
jgi:hypothetical protein